MQGAAGAAVSGGRAGTAGAAGTATGAGTGTGAGTATGAATATGAGTGAATATGAMAAGTGAAAATCAGGWTTTVLLSGHLELRTRRADRRGCDHDRVGRDGRRGGHRSVDDGRRIGRRHGRDWSRRRRGCRDGRRRSHHPRRERSSAEMRMTMGSIISLARGQGSGASASSSWVPPRTVTMFSLPMPTTRAPLSSSPMRTSRYSPRLFIEQDGLGGSERLPDHVPGRRRLGVTLCRKAEGADADEDPSSNAHGPRHRARPVPATKSAI